jgi:hypothetical protein
MPPRAKKTDTSSDTTAELCRRCFPNGWAGVEAVVPDAATVSCEHGSYYHPDRYIAPADDELAEDPAVEE